LLKNQNDVFVKILIKTFKGKFVEEYPCKGMSTKNAVVQRDHSGGGKTLKSSLGRETVKKGENKNEIKLF
jgi:hypothetical protein